MDKLFEKYNIYKSVYNTLNIILNDLINENLKGIHKNKDSFFSYYGEWCKNRNNIHKLQQIIKNTETELKQIIKEIKEKTKCIK